MKQCVFLFYLFFYFYFFISLPIILNSRLGLHDSSKTLKVRKERWHWLWGNIKTYKMVSLKWEHSATQSQPVWPSSCFTFLQALMCYLTEIFTDAGQVWQTLQQSPLEHRLSFVLTSPSTRSTQAFSSAGWTTFLCFSPHHRPCRKGCYRL